jgi:zinc transport system substrate-binding protein
MSPRRAIVSMDLIWKVGIKKVGGGRDLMTLVRAILLLCTLMLFGCAAQEDSGKPIIAVTSYPMYEFTSNIVTDDFEVWLMLPPGLNAHSYEPTPQDIVKLERAEVLVYTNDYFELWAPKTIAGLSKNITAIDASSNVSILQVSEGKDPHTWLSPRTSVDMVRAIADGLSDRYPEKAQEFGANADNYMNGLGELDKRFSDGTSSCAHREMFVSHAAFGYLARDYKLEQVPIIDNFEPVGEVSLADLQKLVEEAKEKNATHIFFEEYISPKLSEAVADEIGAKTAVFSPMEAYSESQLKNDSYIKTMDRNLNVLKEALGCD